MTNLHLASPGARRPRATGLWAALAFVLALIPRGADAAPGDRSRDGVWTDLGDARQTALRATDRTLMPEAYHVFQLDGGALDQILAAAPDEKDVAAKDGVVLSFPMPDGTYARFAVVDSPILEPEAQAMIPDMRTYLAQGLDDPTAVLRFDVGYWGLRAYGRTSQGTLWIDPWQLGDRTSYISAWKHDFPRDDDGFTCEFVDDAPADLGGDKSIPSSGSQLHRYRLIPTLTGEYSVFFGGTGPAMAAATTTINRVNAVFEVDTAVRFVIQAWLAYGNPATDPFTTGSVVTSTLLAQNQAAVDAAYGTAAYDIGHILTQGGGGGLAFLGVACNASLKARGGTGLANPQGDPFDIDYVAHEIGHQMGAAHTFNGTTGSCGGGNRNAATAFEPGSGSTVMAYAGICGAENLQPHSDPYFHVVSLEQIISFRNSTSCQTVVATGNLPPVADAGPDATIPRDTPFYVVAGASDGNGDAVTYCWEEYDLGNPSPPTDPFGPLFRSFNPTGANYRYFPDLAQILAGASDPWEVYPTVNRSLTLRVTARDNRAGGGGVDDDELELTVAGAPFEVLTPNGGETFTAGQSVNVTWTVGGGNVAANVNIFLLAGSFYFLAASTPNDGQATVEMPCGLTRADCRVWVDAVTATVNGVHFFDVSDANFTLNDGTPDFLPYAAGGWGDNVIASPVPLAEGSWPLPATLTGDATSYLGLCYANLGTASGCGGFVNSLSVDGVVTYDAAVKPAPFWFQYVWNIARQVSGGRHTLWQYNDPGNALTELDENNNAHARQWVWEPQLLASESQQLRAHPPQNSAGTEHLTTPGAWNIDGLRIPPASGWWRGMAVSNPDPSHDYDIYLYNPSTGVENGFDYLYLAGSASGGPYTDAVISNRNTMGNPTYDVGALNWNGAATDYRLESRESDATLTIGGEFSRNVAEHQMVRLEEFLVDTGQNGWVTLELKNVTAGQPVTLAVFDASFTEGSIYNATYTANVGPDGRALVQFQAAVGYYGVAIYRHAFQGTTPFTYSLKLWQSPADLAAVTLPGSHAPLIPRNVIDIPAGNPVPAPAQLDGDVGNTVMYFHMANLGPVATQPFNLDFQFDGVSAFDVFWPFGDLPPDPSIIHSQYAYYFNIRGGRHTAGLVLDSQNTNLEIDEANNRYGEQWVWLPSQLAPGSFAGRVPPPQRDGGWADVPGGGVLYDNVDGLRSQTFVNEPNDDGFWGAVAILPAGPADVDVRLHAPTTAPNSGFDTILEQSTWGGSASDFVLVDFDGPHAWNQAWDAGVLRFSGEAGYTIQSVASTFLNYGGLVLPATYGPFPISQGRVISLLEFGTQGVVGDATFRIDLDNLSGGANLGLSVYARNDASGYYSKGEYVFGTDSAGAGGDESLEVTLPGGGYFALVVWKADHNDLFLDAAFTVTFRDPNTTDVPGGLTLPTVSRIESVYPNPFNPQTTVLLAMRQAGPASVKVYDVQGRLVRTLVDGSLAAGRHELRWNGVDDTGRSVPSGVYVVRAVHPDGTDRQRMSLVK